MLPIQYARINHYSTSPATKKSWCIAKVFQQSDPFFAALTGTTPQSNLNQNSPITNPTNLDPTEPQT